MARRDESPRATPDWWPLAREGVEEQPGAREAEAEEALRREEEAPGDPGADGTPLRPPARTPRPPGRGRRRAPGPRRR